MPKLTRSDWEKLRNEYHVAFSGMHQRLFSLLLEKVYAGEKEGNPGELDDIDALLIAAAHAEPPIPPAKVIS
jgi:hypothetical protein